MAGHKRKYTNSVKGQQMLVLQEIYKAKDVLFWKFLPSLTKAEISREWVKIARIAASYGLVSGANGNKFRRTTWQNWRRSAMNKVDRMRQMGVGGASSKGLLDENDKLILSIVGEEIAEGLDEFEADGVSCENTEDALQPGKKKTCVSDDFPHFFGQNPSASKQPSASKKKVDELLDLKIEYLKLCIYDKRLECRELEIRLNLAQSSLTESLFVCELSDSSD